VVRKATMESDIHVHTHTHADTVRGVRARETSHSEMRTVVGHTNMTSMREARALAKMSAQRVVLGAGHAYISTKSCVTGQTHAHTTRQQQLKQAMSLVHVYAMTQSASLNAQLASILNLYYTIQEIGC